MSDPKAGRLSLARVSREVDCGSGVGEQRRQDCVQPPSAISVGRTVFSQTLRIDWLECASSEYPQVALYLFSNMNVFYLEHNYPELHVAVQITLQLDLRWGPAFTAGPIYP